MKETPLFSQHVALGAKMVDFGGWHMPIQYQGIKQEHLATRSAGGLFDVSHMGQARLTGPTAKATVDKLMTNNPGKLTDGQAMYTLMCQPNGGIIDDLIVYREADDNWLLILNASNTTKDLRWIEENAESGTTVANESDATGLIAVQGPRAVELVNSLSTENLTDVPTFSFVRGKLDGLDAMIARTGYTGEDGFEIATSASLAPKLWAKLVDMGASMGIVPVGLGARDTLRLEAKLCLYGNDLNETISPLEATLSWAVKMDGRDFIGKEALLAQKEAGIPRKLVGFRIEGRGIPRHGYPVHGDNGEVIGEVTSGGKGISVEGSIGMALIARAQSAFGSKITIDCRGKKVAAEIVKGKFYNRS